jgi:hypothetical protein
LDQAGTRGLPPPERSPDATAIVDGKRRLGVVGLTYRDQKSPKQDA